MLILTGKEKFVFYSNLLTFSPGYDVSTLHNILFINDEISEHPEFEFRRPSKLNLITAKAASIILNRKEAGNSRQKKRKKKENMT